MRASTIHSEQGRFRITELDVSPPEISDTQLLVRVRATSLNRGELAGKVPEGQSKRFGNEAAGEVIAVGKNVREFQVGDRVMGRCEGGCAEQVAMDEHEAMHAPAHLDWTQAAAIPLVFTVAYDMLFWQRPVGSGDTVLITSVPSGVGIASMQLAKAMGARVIGTSTRQEKLDALLSHGLDIPLLAAGPGFAQKVLESTGGKGVQLAINIVGGSLFEDCLASLAIGGRLAIVGHVDGAKDSRIDLASLHAKRLSVFGVSNKYRTPAERAELVRDMKKDALPFFREGGIVPLIHRVFNASDAQAAIELMQSNAHTGKIILTL